MAEPKVLSRANEDAQLTLDFTPRFSEIAWKEADKAVTGILKGLAILGLGAREVDSVMRTIHRFAPIIDTHVSKD